MTRRDLRSAETEWRAHMRVAPATQVNREVPVWRFARRPKPTWRNLWGMI